MGENEEDVQSEAVDDGSSFSVPQELATAEEGEPLVLELADPAPVEDRPFLRQDRPPALIQKMDSLLHTVSELEARGALQYQQLAAFLEQLLA